MNKKIMVVAGEASADLHASSLVHHLKKLNPEIGVYGIGGENLKKAGADIWFDFSKTGVVGIWEVIPKLKLFLSARQKLLQSLDKENPDLVLLLDLPDFNLNLAKKIKQKRPSQKIVYYISPQVWAWRRGRVRTIKKYIDLMLVIFPFEAEFYQEALVPVKFVGHPLLERVQPSKEREILRKELGVGSEEFLLAFLPGSRKEELAIYLPSSLSALERLQAEFPLKIILARAPTLNEEMINSYLKKSRAKIEIISDKIYDLLFAGDLGLIGSGTATLESALAGLPMIILARTRWLNYFLARPFIHTKFYGLPNLIAEKKIAPELVMRKVNPQEIYFELKKLLISSGLREEMRFQLLKIRKLLGTKKASEQAGKAIMELLEF